MPSNNKKNEVDRILRILYTDGQVQELGKKLAETLNDITQVESDFDRVKTEFKAKLSAHEALKVDLTNKVSTGYHLETVKCKWIFDTPEIGMKTLTRLDTLEKVEEAKMTDVDLQGELPLAVPEGTIKDENEDATKPPGKEAKAGSYDDKFDDDPENEDDKPEKD